MAELIRRQRGGGLVVLGPCRHAPAMPKWRCFNRVTSIMWWRPTRSAWASTWILTMSPSPRPGNSSGFTFRQLTAAELGQIAGRAGRYMNDGTFGVTAEAEAVLRRADQPARGPSFRARPRPAMAQSRPVLRLPPGASGVAGRAAAKPGADQGAGKLMSRRSSSWRASSRPLPLASTPRTVELLWEVCQVPDYRNISGAEHATLLARVFRFLTALDSRRLVRPPALLLQSDPKAISTRWPPASPISEPGPSLPIATGLPIRSIGKSGPAPSRIASLMPCMNGSLSVLSIAT